MYAYAKLIMHNATKMMVAHDHIIKPPKFDVAIITEMKNKSLLSQIPKPTVINGICKQRLLFLYSTESENTQQSTAKVYGSDPLAHCHLVLIQVSGYALPDLGYIPTAPVLLVPSYLSVPNLIAFSWL